MKTEFKVIIGPASSSNPSNGVPGPPAGGAVKGKFMASVTDITAGVVIVKDVLLLSGGSVIGVGGVIDASRTSPP